MPSSTAARSAVCASELLLDAKPRALTKGRDSQVALGTTFVSDATLTSLVAELRAAIGDAARSPRFIRTIHGWLQLLREVSAATTHLDGAVLATTRRLIVGDREIVLPSASTCSVDRVRRRSYR